MGFLVGLRMARSLGLRLEVWLWGSGFRSEIWTEYASIDEEGGIRRCLFMSLSKAKVNGVFEFKIKACCDSGAPEFEERFGA